MKVLRKLLDNYIPKYARWPLLIVLIFNCVVYFFPKLVIAADRYHYITSTFEDRLPFVPAFIVIYVLAFVQWGLGYIIIARDSRERCYQYLSGELIAKALALACFLIYPTAMVHDEFEVTGPATWLTALIYMADTPTINLFPSVHCLASWFCFRGAIGLKRMPRWYPWVQLGFTLLVFVAVLLVKQHIWPDIPAGIAVVEIGLFLGKRFHAERFFERLEKKPKE